jgi:hypothetical protein
MAHLKEIDPVMYECLAQGHNMEFWYNPDSLSSDMIEGRFCINDGLCNWGDYGIMARLVEGRFMMDGTGGQFARILRRNKAVAIVRAAFEQTILWMDRHEFPAELVKWNKDRMQLFTE